MKKILQKIPVVLCRTAGLAVCLALAPSAPAQTNATVPVYVASPTNPCYATVSWSGVTAAAGYQLFWGTNSGVYTQQVDCQSNTTVTVSNLAVGGTYFFAVQSTNGLIASTNSAEVSVRFLLNLPAPAGVAVTKAGQ